MKRALLFTGLILAFLGAIALAGDQTAWFDMNNCEMCQIWFGDAQMMQAMKWEQHKTKDGMLSITTVAPEYLDKYREADKAASKLGDTLRSGYQATLCGCCSVMGTSMAHGATMEHILTDNGSVLLLTVDKPEVVEEIHAIVDRNKMEMAKMMGEPKEHDHDHDGDGHPDH